MSRFEKSVAPDRRSGPRAKTLKRMRQENPGAEQTQKCGNRLEHRDKSLKASAITKRHGAAHSQKDSAASSQMEPD
jgi:hypothetical protein